MKKAAAGFLAGIVITLTATAYADDAASLVGRPVQEALPLLVDGARTARQAIVVRNQSYLPAGTVGELFGYRTEIVDGQILMTEKPADPDFPSAAQPSPSEERPVSGGTVRVGTHLFPLEPSLGRVEFRNGETYISANLLGAYRGTENGVEVIRLPGQGSVKVDRASVYLAGAASYWDGEPFISLSALGLTAIPDGTEGILLVRS